MSRISLASLIPASVFPGIDWEQEGQRPALRPVRAFEVKLRGSETPVSVYAEKEGATELGQPIYADEEGIPGWVASSLPIDIIPLNQRGQPGTRISIIPSTGMFLMPVASFLGAVAAGAKRRTAVATPEQMGYQVARVIASLEKGSGEIKLEVGGNTEHLAVSEGVATAYFSEVKILGPEVLHVEVVSASGAENLDVTVEVLWQP